MTKEYLKKIFNFGNYTIADFVKEETKSKKYPLDLYQDKDGAIRLLEQPSKENLWGKYWYQSGINPKMAEDLKDIVQEINKRFKLNKNDIWLDIACNDGTLLSYVDNNITKIGIDPSEGEIFEKSSKVATVIQDYFSADAYFKVTKKKAKVITCIAMFYDVIDPYPFIEDLFDCLDKDGIVVLQMSYTPLMLEQNAFDNICHEHFWYYDLHSICKKFGKYFSPIDCSLNDVNGGSFRITFMKNRGNHSNFSSSFDRIVMRMRLDSLYHLEDFNDDYSDQFYDFAGRIEVIKEYINDLVMTAKKENKSVWGYGASTKGSTAIQYFGLTNEYITAIADRNPSKHGLRTVAGNIPIVSEEEMRQSNPDYVIIFPWHFTEEFIERERKYLENGGTFIVFCPQFKIITKEDIK